MLKDQAIDAFLDTIELEKELYFPLMALLRAKGFRKINLLAGHYEHGKDIIAQHVQEDDSVVQFVFPVKNGDLDQDKFTKLRSQIFECVDYNYGHVDFDGKAPRVIAIVFPGQMIGKTAGWIEAFNQSCEQQKRSILIEPWGRQKLKEEFEVEHCLQNIEWTKIASFVNEICNGAGMNFIERQTEDWHASISTGKALWAKATEVSVLGSFLRKQKLRLHSIQLVYSLIRTAMVLEYENVVPKQDTAEVINFACDIIYDETAEFLSWFKSVPIKRRAYSLLHVSPSELVEFPVRTISILQFVSVSVIAKRLDSEQASIARVFFQTALAIDALAKPISDNYAPSVLAIAVAARILGVDCQNWISNIACWICDSSENEPGLASAGSNEYEELWRTCGAQIENDNFKPNISSTLAAAALVACSLLDLTQLYDVIFEDFSKVGVLPRLKIPISPPDEFFTARQACLVPSDRDYFERYKEKKAISNLPASYDIESKRLFDLDQRFWIGVSLGLLCRDRWWISSLKLAVSEVTPYEFAAESVVGDIA